MGRAKSQAQAGTTASVWVAKVLSSALSPEAPKADSTAMEAMRPYVESLARELVAAIPAGEEIDAVAAITSPLPVRVMDEQAS